MSMNVMLIVNTNPSWIIKCQKNNSQNTVYIKDDRGRYNTEEWNRTLEVGRQQTNFMKKNEFELWFLQWSSENTNKCRQSTSSSISSLKQMKIFKNIFLNEKEQVHSSRLKTGDEQESKVSWKVGNPQIDDHSNNNQTSSTSEEAQILTSNCA